LHQKKSFSGKKITGLFACFGRLRAPHLPAGRCFGRLLLF